MSETSTTTGRGAGSSAQDDRKRGFFSRILLFIRQVVDEMRKVVWPTRHELTQYTAVVLVFLFFVMGYIVGLDQVFKKFVEWLFTAG